MTEHEKPPLYLQHGYTYIALQGAVVDAIGAQCQAIPPPLVDNRLKRDGPHSHLTVIHPKEMKTAFAAANIEFKKKHLTRGLKALMAWISDRVGEPTNWLPPVDLGLAYARNDESEAYYRVLHWTMGQEIRRQLGLEPAFFHVTLGFHPKDVHGLYKGPGTLLLLSQLNDQMSPQLLQLIDIARHYAHDTTFIQALAHQCRHYQHHLAAQSIDWTHISEHAPTTD